MRSARHRLACLTLVVAACHPAGARTAIPEAIEPSPERDAATRPFGDGDPEVARCLSRAASCTQGSESCAAACRDHDLAACHRLASQLDTECRRRLESLACAALHAPACFDLGAELSSLANEAGRGRELLEIACDLRHGRACTQLALAVAETPARLGEATALFERACAAGDGEGCSRAGRHYNQISEVDRGAALLERGCGLGHALGCVDLARAHLTGAGVSRSEARALELLDGVCRLPAGEDSDGTACSLLATLLDRGRPAGVSVSGPARAAYERGCDKGSHEACTIVLEGHYLEARYAEAVTLASRLLDEQPAAWRPREMRALSLLHLGRFEESARDHELLCELRADWPHCQLLLYVARSRSGGDGRADLERARAGVENVWPAPVMDFFLGRIGEAALLRSATSPIEQTELEQRCEAFYYLGQHHLAAGRKAAAKQRFQSSVATGIREFIEHAGAQAELDRLK